MDVSIGHLRLVGRLLGDADRARTSAVVDQLTGPAARERLLEELSAAFDGDEVLVFRSLDCTATLLRNGGAAEVLARSITASAARVLREHPGDDDQVVRFPDEAAYVTAFVLDYLDGRHDRWYYEAFEPYRRRDSTVDLVSLLAAHRLAQRLRVLAGVRRAGALDLLLDLVGARADELVADSADSPSAAWSPLVTAAIAVVSSAAGRSFGPADPALVERLAAEEAPPDWRDAASLGDAVAAAAVAVIAASGLNPADDLLARLVAAAAEHEWFDPTAFERGLTARRVHPAPADAPAPPQQRLSPRTRQLLSVLAVVAADPALRLDPERATSSTNRLALLAALADADAQWNDDDLAWTLAGQVLDRWAAATRAGPQTAARASASHRQAPGHDLGARAGEGQAPQAAAPGKPPTDGAASRTPPHATTPPAMRAVVDVLVDRFPGPVLGTELAESSVAAGLLLLRGALDLGLSAYLLDETASGRPLLSELLDRWGGTTPDVDPLHDLVAKAVERGPGPSRLDPACRLAADRLLGQGHLTGPLRAVTVPHGSAALLTVVTDGSGRLLPLGSLDGPAGLTERLDEEGVEVDGESDAADVRAAVSAVLASVWRATRATDEHEVDLLAIACVQAWARWLPGFAGSSVPFLLDTVVRRPTHVDVSDDEIVVALPSRSHDVVLGLAGYLDPVDPGPVLGGRRARFVVGGEHGA